MQKLQRRWDGVSEVTQKDAQWLRTLERLSSGGSVEIPPEVSSQAPSYLKEQILERAAMPDVQAVAAVKKTSKKMQLFYYSLKTAAVVAAALLMLFSVSTFETGSSKIVPGKEPTAQRLTRQINDKSSAVADFLSKFSYEIVRGL